MNSKQVARQIVGVLFTPLFLFALEAPSNLELIPNINAVTIKWKDNSNDEIGYKIFRDDELIAILPQNSTFYVDSGLESNHLYKYTVKATNDEIDGLDRKRDFFPIGLYFVRGQKPITDDGSAKDINEDFRYNPEVASREYGKEFADLKKYHFNTAILKIDPLARVEIDESASRVIDVILEEAKKNSLKLIVPLAHTQDLISKNDNSVSDEDIEQVLKDDFIEKFSNSDVILGYEVYDEPDVNELDLDLIARISNNISNKWDNKAYPLTSWNDINSFDALKNSLDPQVVMTLIYPFAVDEYNGEQADGDTPYGDLSDAVPRGNEGTFYEGNDVPTAREWLDSAYNVANDKPLWAIIQSFGGDTYWRDPLPKELRLEVFTSLLSGAKGVFYFLYQSEDWINGMMDIEYHETPLIKEAKEINIKIEALAPILLQLKKSSKNFAQVSDDGSVQTFESVDLLTGDRRKYILVVNNDLFNSKDIKVTIADSWNDGELIATDKYNGKSYEIQDGSFHIRLDKADGRVFLIE